MSQWTSMKVAWIQFAPVLPQHLVQAIMEELWQRLGVTIKVPLQRA